MTGVQQINVKADEDGMRIDRWFRSRWPHLKQGQLQKLFRTGQVRLDGGRVKSDSRVAKGQTVRVPPLPEKAPPGDGAGKQAPSRMPDPETARMLQDTVIFKDKDILAINKPPGLPVQGGSGITRHLDGMLKALQFDAPEIPRLVHRLDKDTSGVLLLARNRKAAQWLTKVFRDRQTEKTYWALVLGHPRPDRGVIRGQMAKMSGYQGDMMTLVDDGGQHSETIYATVAHAAKQASWLAMRPVTGRTHQLRVHAEAIGHAIVGDGKYGGPDAHLGGGVSRKLHLHARSIGFDRPGRGWLEIEAELPRHMAESWSFFGFEAKDPMAKEVWEDY